MCCLLILFPITPSLCDVYHHWWWWWQPQNVRLPARTSSTSRTDDSSYWRFLSFSLSFILRRHHQQPLIRPIYSGWTSERTGQSRFRVSPRQVQKSSISPVATLTERELARWTLCFHFFNSQFPICCCILHSPHYRYFLYQSCDYHLSFFSRCHSALLSLS